MEPSCIRLISFIGVPFLPHYGFRTQEWLSVEDEWLIAARDRAPSHDGGSMWLMLVNG
jgi:hypothetical protein